MENTKIIERFGALIKEEPLTYVQDDILMANTCVLEAVSPYCGYYSHEPQAQKPQHLYLVLNAYYSFETITRTTQYIRKKSNYNFDAALCNITVFGNTCQAIRIRNLLNYTHLRTLQQMYQEEGITFKKKSMKIENQCAMIKLRKFFLLEQIGENTYIDKGEPHHVYFGISEQIDWAQLKKLINQIKLDTCNFYFDAALAFIYDKEEIKDMIRIYRENITIEEIKSIKEKCLASIVS